MEKARKPLQLLEPLQLQEKRDLVQVSRLWRRTRDSNPRGCYTLLAFQASSLATRSILHDFVDLYNISKESLVCKSFLLRQIEKNHHGNNDDASDICPCIRKFIQHNSAKNSGKERGDKHIVGDFTGFFCD